MSPVTDKPVTIPDRELADEKRPRIGAATYPLPALRLVAS